MTKAPPKEAFNKRACMIATTRVDRKPKPMMQGGYAKCFICEIEIESSKNLVDWDRSASNIDKTVLSNVGAADW